jgi:hypothetical protein
MMRLLDHSGVVGGSTALSDFLYEDHPAFRKMAEMFLPTKGTATDMRRWWNEITPEARTAISMRTDPEYVGPVRSPRVHYALTRDIAQMARAAGFHGKVGKSIVREGKNLMQSLHKVDRGFRGLVEGTSGAGAEFVAGLGRATLATKRLRGILPAGEPVFKELAKMLTTLGKMALKIR